MPHYDAIHSQDTQYTSKPYGSIQWKGTDACIDMHCACGFLGHVDGDFAYYYHCTSCGAKYALGSNIKLIPLTEEQSEYVETERNGFHTDDDRRGE